MNNQHIQKLKDDGYLVVQNFLSATEIEQLRNLCLSPQFSKTDSVVNGDLITHAQFREIFLSNNLIAKLKELIGEDIYYICDGSARGADKPYSKDARKFHTDSRADDFDFSKEYPLYRIGMYLQDMDQHSGGLKIRPKSHKRLCIDHGTSLYEGFYRYVKYLLKYKQLPPVSIGPGENVKCKAGDLLIWNMRLHHSGHAIRLKALRNISLYPFIERWIPKSWIVTQEQPRCVLFFAFGKNCDYLRDYFFYVSEHPHSAKQWQQNDFSEPVLVAHTQELKIKLLSNMAIVNPESRDEFKRKKFF